MFSLYVGYVSGVTDDYAAGRIKAIIPPDKGSRYEDIPLSFPLLPKMIHVFPKDQEAVLVLVENDKEANGQRFYIGPIISQPEKIGFDNYFDFSATGLLNGGVTPPNQSVENRPNSDGALPKKDEIAILGRKDSDIILSDEDVRIRAGVRQTNPTGKTVNFDEKEHSAYMKLKYHEQPIMEYTNSFESSGNGVFKTPVLKLSDEKAIRSTATVVADRINLLTNNGDEHFELFDKTEGITDKEMKSVFEKAHKLPYGDVLCDFFASFLKLFVGHFHPYHYMPPEITGAEEFMVKYGIDKDTLEKKLLSENIRIN